MTESAAPVVVETPPVTTPNPGIPPTSTPPATVAPATQPAIIPAAPTPIGFGDLQLPDGATALPEALQAKALEIFNKDMSPKERAQAFLNLNHEIATTAVARRSTEWDALMENWSGSIKADPEVGGAKYDANRAIVSQLVTKFGTPALNEVLETTGAGNHPAMFKFLVKLAPALLEGGITPTPTPAGQGDTTSAEQRMYPSMQPK